MAVRFAIIGLGNIAQKFASDLQRVPAAQLVAVASQTLGKAQHFATQFNVPRFYDSYEKMLVAGDIDVVYIATTNETHFMLTLLCLKYKIGVLCEKPLALNTKQVEKMIATARRNNVFLMEALWSYFVPAFKEVIDLATIQKMLGDVLYVKADFGGFFPFNAEARHYNLVLGGGALLDIGIYPIALALQVLGMPQKIQAQAQLNAITGTDDICSMQFQHARGFSQLSAAFVAKMPIEAAIYCENGYFHLPQRFHHPHSYTVARYDGRNGPITETFELPYKGFGYQFEIEEVCNCINARFTESHVLTHQKSIDLMRTMDSVRKQIGLRYSAI